MEWRKDKAPNSIGEVLFLGPWNVGGVHYDIICSKDDVMKYTATCKLPGVKWPGKFQTVKEAKAAVEYSVKHWLSQLQKQEEKPRVIEYERMIERNGEVFVVAKELEDSKLNIGRGLLGIGKELLDLVIELLNVGNKHLRQETRIIPQDTVKELLGARKYVKHVHDEAEYMHDNGGEGYMEVIQDTEALIERIDNAIRGHCSQP